MSSTSPATGDEIYLDNGQAAVYVSREFDGHIVRAILSEGDEENEPRYGRPTLVPLVFQVPPAEKYSAEVERLREQQSSLQKEVAALRGQLNVVATAREQQMKELQAHSDLTRLADYIAGRITHVVRIEYSSLRIETFEEAFGIKDDYGRREPGLKLLTLFSVPHGGVGAYLNRYKDGSGSDTEIIPCISHEDALAKAQQHINRLVEIWRADPTKAYRLGDHMKSALALGLTVPDEVKAYLHAAKVIQARAGVEKAETELLKARDALGALVPEEG